MQSGGGRFLVRIEDIDDTRCTRESEESILEDLAWLGLTWEEPVVRQSERMAHYRAALNRLQDAGLLYPCVCTRKDILAASSAPQNAKSVPYPGICRGLSPQRRSEIVAGDAPFALRLDTAEAFRRVGPLSFFDRSVGRVPVEVPGDFVVARKDTPTSYHLSVVVDDADQKVTLVTRGTDLLSSTHEQRLLQAVLDLPEPEYRHHPLCVDPDSGRRFAKRDQLSDFGGASREGDVTGGCARVREPAFGSGAASRRLGRFCGFGFNMDNSAASQLLGEGR